MESSRSRDFAKEAAVPIRNLGENDENSNPKTEDALTAALSGLNLSAMGRPEVVGAATSNSAVIDGAYFTKERNSARTDGPRAEKNEAFNPSMMRFAMPAPAGLPTNVRRSTIPQITPSAGRGYKMASDIFGTGMSRPWSTQTEAEQNAPGNRNHEPASFKITEPAGRGTSGTGGASAESLRTTELSDDASGSSTATRRARESSGNPLTGQGYDDASSRTAKRYFDGSNSNQKLW